MIAFFPSNRRSTLANIIFGLKLDQFTEHSSRSGLCRDGCWNPDFNNRQTGRMSSILAYLYGRHLVSTLTRVKVIIGHIALGVTADTGVRANKLDGSRVG
jgi:hypothetical protein